MYVIYFHRLLTHNVSNHVFERFQSYSGHLKLNILKQVFVTLLYNTTTRKFSLYSYLQPNTGSHNQNSTDYMWYTRNHSDMDCL